MLARPRGRWARLPVWARLVLVTYIIGFVDGTADHVRWMLHGGIHAYAASYPQVPIQVLFVSLVVLDPLAAVLAGLVRAAGIGLAVGIMVTDMIANWVGNWDRITTSHAGAMATVPWLITAFGLLVLVTSVPLLRAIRPDHAGVTSTSETA